MLVEASPPPPLPVKVGLAPLVSPPHAESVNSDTSLSDVTTTHLLKKEVLLLVKQALNGNHTPLLNVPEKVIALPNQVKFPLPPHFHSQEPSPATNFQQYTIKFVIKIQLLTPLVPKSTVFLLSSVNPASLLLQK